MQFSLEVIVTEKKFWLKSINLWNSEKSVSLRKWVNFWQLNSLSAHFLILGKFDPMFVAKLVSIMGGRPSNAF